MSLGIRACSTLEGPSGRLMRQGIRRIERFPEVTERCRKILLGFDSGITIASLHSLQFRAKGGSRSLHPKPAK